VKNKIKSKVQGTISEQRITIDLMEMGYDVALFPSDNCPVDLVAHHVGLPGNGLVRLQVKTPRKAVSGIHCPTVKLDWRKYHSNNQKTLPSYSYNINYDNYVDYLAYPWQGIGVYVPVEYVNGKTSVTIPTKHFCMFRELKPEHRVDVETYGNDDITNHKQTELFF